MSTISQRSFSGGEISPQIQARVDFQKYQTSLKTMRNFIALKQGGAQNRGGTEFGAEVLDSHGIQRLIPFDAGNGAAYALEFGDQYFRIYKNNVLIKDPALVFTVTNFTWSPAKVFGTGTPGGIVSFSGFNDALGAVLNGRDLKLGSISGGGYPVLNMDGTPFVPAITPAYTSGGTLNGILQVFTGDGVFAGPILEEDLFDFKYAQSVDVLTMVHPEYEPIEILRFSDTNWVVRGFGQAFDSPGFARLSGVTNIGTAGSTTYDYVATGVYGGIESGVFGPGGPTPNSYRDTVTGNATLSSTNFNRITRTTPSVGTGQVTPDSYNLYKRAASGIYGYIANFTGTTFDDIGLVPDEDIQPPSIKYPYINFNNTDDHPSTVAYAQQRRFFGGTNNNPEGVYGSDIADYQGFYTKTPVTDSTSIAFRAAGRKFNPVKHILDLSKLILMTASSEIVVNPDGSVLTPTNINIKTQSYNGSSDLQPIIINESALYVQEKGNIVRDLLFDFNIDGFSGNDISILANHLFEGYTIVDWCYQQVPNSNVWAVRSDGTLLCLTYLREQQVLAWSRHDIGGNGLVKSCCAVSGTDQDDVYFLVERTINGVPKKYVERLNDRFLNTNKQKIVRYSGVDQVRYYNAINECRIMDSVISYDGRNTLKTRDVTLTTAGGWTTEDDLTLTASASIFSATDVGNSYFIYTEDQDVLRVEITAYTSGTVVTVRPLRDVPVELQGISTSDYARAVDVLRGLWHLEGEEVAVFSDGFVDASPNNPNYEKVTVENGTIILSSNRAVVHVGLPFISDLQTLAIDTIQAETMIDKKIVIQEVTMSVEKTRGLFVGRKPPDESISFTEGLTEVKARNNEGNQAPIDLRTGPCDVVIESGYSVSGSVFVRQVDPLPATILSIHPAGNVPFRRG